MKTCPHTLRAVLLHFLSQFFAKDKCPRLRHATCVYVIPYILILGGLILAIYPFTLKELVT